jgi:hypothetical protein
MAAFGVSTSQTGVFLDTLNKAGQDTGVSVEQLASLMTSNAAAMKEMGFSASDTAMFIANLSKQGIDTSVVMAGMKKALANAIAEGKPMNEAMSELQNTMASATSDTEAYQKAVELFGAKAGPAIAEACQSGRLSFEQLGTSMDDFAGNVESTFNETLDPIDQMQVNLNKMKLVGADLVNAAAPMITQAMKMISKAVEKLSKFWNGLSEKQQQAIIKFALVVAAIGPVISVLGKFVTGIGGAISIVGKILPVLGSLGSVMGAISTFIGGTLIPIIGSVLAAIAPFLPIIAAVVGAIVGVIAIIKNWGAISTWFKGVFNNMKDGIGNATESIKGKFASLKDSIAEKSEGIRSSVSNAWNNAKNAVGTAWNGLVANCKKGVDQTGRITGGLVWGMAATFGGLANSALTWGRDMIQNFINGIQHMWNALKNKVKGVAKLISDYLHFSEPEKGPLSDFNESGGDMMKNFATGIENAQYLVRNAVSDVALDIQSQLGEPLDYDRIYGAVRDGASSATTKIVLNNREVTRALGGMGVVING